MKTDRETDTNFYNSRDCIQTEKEKKFNYLKYGLQNILYLKNCKLQIINIKHSLQLEKK